MTETVETLNFLLAAGGVVLLALSAALLVDIFFYGRKCFSEIAKKHGMYIAALLTILGSVMTLIYSDVFGFVPCGLCWLQRVFLYPQAFITTTALIIKDKTAALYGIVLSVPGLLVSLYQHYLQMGGAEIVGCPVSDGDCAKRIVFEFGFMTFPLMSAALFLFLILLYTYLLRTGK